MVPQMGTAWGQLAGVVCWTRTYRERVTHLIRRSMNKTPGGLSVDKLPEEAQENSPKKPHDMLVPSGDMGFVANSDPGAILSMEI